MKLFAIALLTAFAAQASGQASDRSSGPVVDHSREDHSIPRVSAAPWQIADQKNAEANFNSTLLLSQVSSNVEQYYTMESLSQFGATSTLRRMRALRSELAQDRANLRAAFQAERNIDLKRAYASRLRDVNEILDSGNETGPKVERSARANR